MFGNRSDNSNNVWNIGYDSNLEDIVGSSTWLRRMDRYEKEFDKAISDTDSIAILERFIYLVSKQVRVKNQETRDEGR